jgi:hypothetical protein
MWGDAASGDLLCIIPTGLIYSRVEHVNLRRVAKESEAAAVETLQD